MMTKVVRSTPRVPPRASPIGASFEEGHLVRGGASWLIRTFMVSHTRLQELASRSMVKDVAKTTPLQQHAQQLKSVIRVIAGGSVGNQSQVPTNAESIRIDLQRRGARPSAKCIWIRSRYRVRVVFGLSRAAVRSEEPLVAENGGFSDQNRTR